MKIRHEEKKYQLIKKKERKRKNKKLIMIKN